MELFILEGPWPVYVRYLNGYVPIDTVDDKRLKYQEEPLLVNPESAIDYLRDLGSGNVFQNKRVL